jgi:hypothetical protein
MKSNVLLSLGAGLVGGFASHYLSPQPVHAQSIPAAPAHIRAQSFTLVNASGATLGTFCFDAAGRPVIRLMDEHGREVWSAGSSVHHAALGPK